MAPLIGQQDGKTVNPFVPGIYGISITGGVAGINLTGQTGTATLALGANLVGTFKFETPLSQGTANLTCIINTDGCRQSTPATGTAKDGAGAIQIITFS